MQYYIEEREALNRLTSLIIEKLEEAKAYRLKTIKKIEDEYDPKIRDLNEGLTEKKSELVDVLKKMEVRFKGYKISQRQYFGESLNGLSANLVSSDDALEAIERLIPTWVTKHMSVLTATQTSIVNEWTNSYYKELGVLEKKEKKHSETLRILGEKESEYDLQLILYRRNKGKFSKIFETLKAKREMSKINKEIEELRIQERKEREGIELAKNAVESLKQRVEEKHGILQTFIGNYSKIKAEAEALCDDFVVKKKDYLTIKNDLIACAVEREGKLDEVETVTSQDFVIELVLGNPDHEVAKDIAILKGNKNFVELFSAGAFPELSKKKESREVLEAINTDGLVDTKTIR